MVGLALADICVGFISPFNAYRLDTDSKELEECRMKKEDEMAGRESYCRAWTALELLVIYASIFHFIAMAADR